MIYGAPTLAQGGPSRVLVLKQWFKIEIQVTGAGTVYLGTNKDEAGRVTVAANQDGLQFNAANSTRPYSMWWKGELWASGSDPCTYFVVIVPGLTAEADSTNVCISGEEQTADFAQEAA